MAQSHLKIEDLIVDESFQRWLDNKASASEEKHWIAWLQDDRDNSMLYRQAKELWQTAQFRSVPAPNIEKELAKLRKRLHADPASRATVLKFPSLKLFWNYKQKTSKRGIRYAAIAATIALIIVTWNIFHSGNQLTEIAQTNYGEHKSISLADGSTIRLNANTVLKGSTSPAHYQFVLKGEACFQVVPASNRRFTVKTVDGKIHVVGTKFVVHSRGDGTKAVVEEGVVQVEVFESSDDLIELKNGNIINFHKGQINGAPRKTNVLVHTSWASDNLVFDETSFEEIVQRIEETFAVEIVVKDESLLQEKVSGSIENSDLRIIIEALAKALQVKYTQTGNTIVLESKLEK
ncbi:MAG: DUF4974 domain-containing protein [Calditrichaeota bacterium]|nr:MAG: DUF4974 domain-containing protein [Calditrichota bacterium]